MKKLNLVLNLSDLGVKEEDIDDLVKATLPGGQLVLSGIVQERADEVIEAFADEGAKVVDRIDKDDWVCLLVQAK